MNTATRNRILSTRPATRTGLATLAVAHSAVPAVAAVAGAWLAEYLIADTVTGFGRVTYLALAALACLAAVDRVLIDTTGPVHRLLYGQVHGPRTWSCEDCGTYITARHWTPYEADVFATHLADPSAHDCHHAQQ